MALTQAITMTRAPGGLGGYAAACAQGYPPSKRGIQAIVGVNSHGRSVKTKRFPSIKAISGTESIYPKNPSLYSQLISRKRLS